MNPYPGMSQSVLGARQEQLWQTIVDYRYLAGPKLAYDERLERVVAEANATGMLEAVRGRRSRFGQLTVRDRLGAMLVVAGRRLQGVSTIAPGQARRSPAI
jgi:hypothetical protein